MGAVALYRSSKGDQMPLSVLGFGMQPAHQPVTDRVLGCFAAVLVEQGRGTLRTRTAGICEVMAPALFWLLPDELHSYGPDAGTTWQERWVLFDGSLPRSLAAAGLIRRAEPRIMLHDLPGIAHHFAQLHSEMLDLSPLRQAAAAATVHRLIVDVAFESERTINRRSSLIIEDVVAALQQGALEPLDFVAFARRFGVAPATLRRQFVAHFGIPPKAFQLRLRLDRAKELLSLTDRTVEAIAAEIGFEDAFYFSRLFRAREGCTPTTFRLRNRRY
ncbi:MAG TPA: AraC family transcriptional regulator [Devosiaceae bacterium]|jgi:AraC-like DNA-binding protein